MNFEQNIEETEGEREGVREEEWKLDRIDRLDIVEGLKCYWSTVIIGKKLKNRYLWLQKGICDALLAK